MSLADTASQVLAEAGLDAYFWEEQPTLYPGTDYHDGVLYLTVPLWKTEMVQEGRGKGAVMVPKKVERTIAVTSERDYFDFTPEQLDSRGFVFPQYFVQKRESNWPLPDVKAFLDGSAKAPTGKELFNQLREVFVKHIEYTDDTYYDIVPLYVMASYLYRLFTSTGYLHFNGTAASGKSQNLRLLTAFGFNTAWASNISAASLFRTTAGDPGILCIDEAESFEGERGQELRLILNSGYMNGATTKRAEKTSDGVTHAPTEFHTYGPKVLASINSLEPVIQSRCIVIHMAPAIREIPEFDQYDPQWAPIRAQLYLWAMENAQAVAHRAAEWNNKLRWTRAKVLQARAWQITQQTIVMADYIGGKEMTEPLIKHFAGYFEQMAKAAETVDRQRLLIKILPRVFASKNPEHVNGQVYWALTDIKDVLLEHLDEDQREYYKSRQISRHLNALGFTGRKPHKGGTLVALSEDEVRAQLKRRRVEPFDEDSAWFNNDRNYGLEPSHAPEQQPSTDEYSWLDEAFSDESNPIDE